MHTETPQHEAYYQDIEKNLEGMKQLCKCDKNLCLA